MATATDIGAEEAFEILTDQISLEHFMARSGLSYPEARALLTRLSDELLAEDAPAARSQTERLAEVAGYRGRTDVIELCRFVERVGHLPGRLRDVFYLCVRDGFSINQCAERLGIKRATVRVHLRRLRRLMKQPPANVDLFEF